MRFHFGLCSALLLLTTATLQAGAQGDGRAEHPFLSSLFTSNMVLQRNMKDPIWGWTDPGKEVTVTIGGKSVKAIADAQGKWMAKVGPLHVGGPYKLSVSGPQTVDLDNILVGDVWICSGQSNMEFGLGNANNAKDEIAGANFPQIRLYTVQKTVAFTPLDSLARNESQLFGEWSVCDPHTVATGGWNGFSAVGYFFGRELNQQLDVPIGLIHTSWGGTIAEAWTSAPGLKPLKDFDGALDQVEKASQGQAQLDKGNPNMSTVLYNGMIAPLIPYGIKGAIWYQGESNAGRAYQYRHLLPAMIGDWRTHWGEGDFPFYIVQLANWQALQKEPGDDAWAELREAQSMTAKDVPHAGIAVTIDIGDAGDIHPKDKQDVGKRLALNALAKDYHKKVEYAGPTYKSMQKQGSAIRLSFDHVDRGLVAKGDKPEGFAIAGDDHKWVWADAKIEGNNIVVSSPQVPNPVAVRYAWAINPICNLYNKAGLPASPFRTDDWPGVTANAK
jgi:sialate O-acetylesterase